MADFGSNGQIVTSMNAIAADASGSGYFLFEGTYYYSAAYKSAFNLSIPSTQNQFFISPTFTVSPNTTYTVSYELANADASRNRLLTSRHWSSAASFAHESGNRWQMAVTGP